MDNVKFLSVANNSNQMDKGFHDDLNVQNGGLKTYSSRMPRQSEISARPPAFLQGSSENNKKKPRKIEKRSGIAQECDTMHDENDRAMAAKDSPEFGFSNDDNPSEGNESDGDGMPDIQYEMVSQENTQTSSCDAQISNMQLDNQEKAAKIDKMQDGLDAVAAARKQLLASDLDQSTKIKNPQKRFEDVEAARRREVADENKELLRQLREVHKLREKEAGELHDEIKKLKKQVLTLNNGRERDAFECSNLRATKDIQAKKISEMSRNHQDLNKEFRRVENERNKCWNELCRERENTKNFRSKYPQLEKDNQQLERERIRLNKELQLQKEVAKGTQEYCSQLLNENQKINQNFKDLDVSHKALNAQVRAIQIKEFNTMESARWTPDSSADIEQKLNNILIDIKAWSKRYGKSSSWTPDDIERLLRARGCIGSAEKLRATTKSEDRNAPCWLFLSAVAAYDAFRHIMGDPFFAFRWGDNAAGLAAEDVESLNRILQILEMNDEAGACAWRCQLIRLLDPARPGKSKIKEATSAARLAASEHLTAACLSDVAEVFIPNSDTDAAHAELHAIFLGCAEVAWKLWAQKTRINVLDFETTMLTEGSHRYCHESKVMEHHSLHNRDVCDDAAALDGSEILLLVSPALIAAGSAEGSNFQNSMVWKKAVAWME